MSTAPANSGDPSPQLPTYKKRPRLPCTSCSSCNPNVVLVYFVIAIVPFIIFANLFCNAGGTIYLTKRPTFTLSSLRLAVLNVDSNSLLTSLLYVNVTAHNPGWLHAFDYAGPIPVAASTDGVPIGDGSLPAFSQEPDETTPLTATVTSVAQRVDAAVAASLTGKRRIPLDIQLETTVTAKNWVYETVEIGMVVRCEGIEVSVPKGGATPPPFFPDAPCKVVLRHNVFMSMLKLFGNAIMEVLEEVIEKLFDQEEGLANVNLSAA